MNRVVIDTNVFVSGIAIANTPPSQVMDLWRNGSIVLITSPQLLAEAYDVLTRPKIMAFTGLSVEEAYAFLQEVAKRSYVTAGEHHIEPLTSNPADTAVLQAAVEGRATHIVTGDKKHLLPLKTSPFNMCSGRSFQLGEGWHSTINAVRFWKSSPRIPQETHSRCYASATAYVMMIPLCNSCSARSTRPTRSRS